jgi:tetratricopeptide (TPR) repeat protein
VAGFVAIDDLCGVLEFDSQKPISADDADLKKIFGSLTLDPKYSPRFDDVFRYAQVLFVGRRYKEAGPLFEQALTLLPADGTPFPSAAVGRRVMTGQAGTAYGMAGELAKARATLEKGILADPDYPMHYYNLTCVDAEEKRLAGARLHLQQAFARKANVDPGQSMPDPAKDDSFLPYRNDKEFWAFIERLRAEK